MMGQHPRSEALFYYFRLEDQVPENHLLRLIRKAHQSGLRPGAVEGKLQRDRPALIDPEHYDPELAPRMASRWFVSVND